MMFKRSRPASADHSGPRRDRRAAVRQPLGWRSQYVVRDESRTFFADSDHAPCVVHDLSLEGAGLELPSANVAVGDCVVLDLHLSEHNRGARIRLTGVVRHTRCDEGAPVRAGVEFVEVGNLERALLLRLLRDHSPQARRAG